MTTIEDVIGESTGRSRAVLEYSQTMGRLVKSAKDPGFSVDSWAPLAELIAVDEFIRIGPFKEVMNWDEYVEFLTNWAKSSDWDCSFKRLTETADVAFLELEERSRIGDFSSVVNSASVYEFNADNKIRYIAVYLQMQLPDPATLPDFQGD
ncbi:hypothetical protein [Mycolicibacterium monacense]|uniref:Uncharacterized protein n=4 Tax=Mycobacteriaceae TaxID=1762 RepID=A0AAD1IT07_MYCMB|nr:hypothetical protein [Mycolicibacterium monacense]MDA4102964.1 hypothetical protein [Mycolicibacterium monacense DSM 44395]OBB71014.1 hypothetical protein A6B34_17510 [Mycolicibacterium monacense]ORB14361.1 hypothetical protein BST34_23320 [Mycolicibacterium monacense DSM 44395]QHP87291.1 hypothetical protein EWR22_19085 [Mycolicibacterium monacense DSM 44395]BBZ59593.1 hypothetical protein MMON_08940 [Mycolicibacterium monacense]